MAESNQAWRVLPHGGLEQLSENLWWVSGALPNMSLKRTMTIARRNDGTLVIHSAIALDERTQSALEALGEPSYLLVPNRGHRLDAPRYKARYPKLRVFAPRAAVEHVQKVVAIDGTYEDFPHGDDVRLERLNGVNDTEGLMVVRSQDGITLVFNDVVMNMKKKTDVLGYLFTTIMGSAPGPRVSRLAKLVFVADRAALRADLERYAKTPDLVRVIVAHEDVTHGSDAARTLTRAATYL